MTTLYGAVDSVLPALTELLGERLSTASAVREHRGHDESGFKTVPPDAVAFAHSTEEVSAIVKICARHKIPVIAYGTGTAIEGHVQALRGGVCIDLSGMDRIVEVNPEDMDCTVQAGVTRMQLESHLRDTGLFFPVDPGADASLGGMAATSASGTNAVRYGTMKENVLSLKVVMADGRIIRTGTRAKKSSAGYDLTHLFIGSEGTLGIITEVTLRLHGLQEAISSAVCSFPSVDDAINMVILTIQSGIPIARIELLDGLMMHAINRYSKMDYPEQPHLFLEFHGSAASVKEQAEAVQELASEFGGGNFSWATRSEERNRLWKARHDAYPAALQLQPGTRAITTDVCVPISRLAECIRETREDIDRASMPIVMLGHVGDGNFHLAILPHPDRPQDIEEAEALNHRLVRRALALDGTCSGEHGIGQGKIGFLEEQNPEGVVLMRQLKQTLDPDNLLNPGKVLRMD
ncbi:FAD-binding oxidoreductase [Sedimenticola hydrogenitrophicus]|uniref:FAD-binding oxidoreductase n=1 Tax=Sedimenticola hydrogenitrophicus TaxID=2967975 RepID=UPI0021A6C8B0|nr:FAD-linked oxidase C-terminal domain-containing protein [Sedimenticola hydrogenitrophicus]